jgi:hypothetical protein
MATRYRYVLEEPVVETFFTASEEERDLLIAYFRWLAAHPQAEGHAWAIDAAGRKNFADVCGPFTVAHWTDHAVGEVRIVEFFRS